MNEDDPVDVPPMPALENKWQGWPLDTPLVASSVLRAEEAWPEQSEISEALPFYRGICQWRSDVKKTRIEQGRPVIVINMLPQIVARILSNGPATSSEEWYALLTVVVRHNRDAQMLYNYTASCNAEFASQRSVKVGSGE